MEEPESTFKEDTIKDVEMVAELTTKLNELYREAQLAQIEANETIKSNLLAESVLKVGLERFCSKLFEPARRFYTLCLAYAEEDSELIGQAYANRSATLLNLGYFEQCILDIDRALNSNYPEDKKKSLHERKELALKKAERSPPLASSRTSEVEAEWRDKLRHFYNPHIPGASKKIKLESNKSWGRHLVATENINAGEILTSQKFFTMVNAEEMEVVFTKVQHQVCSYCLLYHPALIPCPTCSRAMYCSDHCLTEAFNSYHRIECRVLRTKDLRENIIRPLRCLLVGTDQGAGLASLMKKIELQDVFDVGANIDESTEKPFSSDYTFLLRLCRNQLLKPLSDKVDFIPKIIIALRKAGYFDSVPDPLQREASNDPKAVGYNNSKPERGTPKDIISKLLDSIKPTHESDDRKEDPDECKNEDRPIVQEHAHSSAIVNTSSENTDEQREAHIDAKDGNNGESVYEKDGDISSEVLESIEVVDESVDKEEDSDVGKNEDKQIVREYEDFSRIVGIEFIKEVRCHYCELCNLCLCYNPEINQDEIILAHRRTPLHIERCSAKNSKEQEGTTQECVTETSPSENVILGTMTKEPQLDTQSKRRSRKKKSKARSKSASDAKSDGTNEQKKLEKSVTNLSLLENVILAAMAAQPRLCSTSLPESSSTVIHTEPPDSLPGSSDENEQNVRELQREAHINAKDVKNDELVHVKDGDISSKVFDSVEIADESLDKKEDPSVGKNENTPIVQVEDEDSSRIVDEEESIKEVSSYYCELCNLCLCYKQGMSKYEVLLAHSSTPLHLERSLFKTTEEKDANTQECMTESSMSKEAEEPPLDSTSQPTDSYTEISTSPLDSLPEGNDANEQNLVERQGFMLVEETSLFKNVNLYGKDVAQPGPSTAIPQQDAYSFNRNANRHHIREYLTREELLVSFLLLNHLQAIDYATLLLRKLDDNYSSETIYGYGVCMFHALINHSCDPNAEFITRGQESALYALKPISTGEQIFITYIGSFASQSLQERQKLLSLTTFNCECVACVNKWPMFNDLLQMPRPNFKVSSKKAGIKAIQKITSPFSGKTADSTSRLEIIQVIGRLCDWLYTNVERPYAVSAECERVLINAMKDFYDTSLLLEVTALRKKEMLDCIFHIASSIRIDLQHLVT